MTASVFSTLNGKLVGKHPELGVLVSEDGKVLCLKKGLKWGNRNAEFHWTEGYLQSTGYKSIRFKQKRYLVHRLVAETFIPNPENKPTVDHYPDRSRDNNNVHNLRWADMQEQRINTKSYDDAMYLGVRYTDDPKEWRKLYARRQRDLKRQDPEWVKNERTYHREYYREYYRSHRQDPKWMKKLAERNRKYKAKKKAEQSAQPSV